MRRIGNAPCSWGTIEGMAGERVEYERMLGELVETGYMGTELGDYGFMPTEPEVLRRELERRNLTMLGAYEGVNLVDAHCHDEGERRAVRTATLLASVADLGDLRWQPFLVLADEHSRNEVRFQNAGRITRKLGLNSEQWATYCAGAERIARTLREETGLKTVFHHHCAGFVETPGEIDTFLARTDPALVGLVLDTGHLVYGSGRNDSSALLSTLERVSERLWYVHLKDVDPAVAERTRAEGLNYKEAVGAGVFCELGRGCVDFAALKQVLERLDYEGWLTVEQDVLPGLGTPKESAARNRTFLASLGW